VDPRAREAPGADEDAQGVPFVGRAGQLLDKIFAAVTIDTNRHCYVTNVVKRRPSNNRDPTAGEIAFYRGYLEEEIRLVDPAVIVLTGRHSMRTVLGKTEGITKIRGTWHEVDGRWVMPMFHPSYLLRNPQRTPGSPKALTWDDVREVKRKIDRLGLIEGEV
jgi:uracil-DNA glycosylase